MPTQEEMIQALMSGGVPPKSFGEDLPTAEPTYGMRQAGLGMLQRGMTSPDPGMLMRGQGFDAEMTDSFARDLPNMHRNLAELDRRVDQALAQASFGGRIPLPRPRPR